MYGHVDVYLDESGDLGFSPSSSRHLVVAGVASRESFRFRRLVRGTRRRFRSEVDRRSELKFNRSSDNLRAHMLNQVAEIDSLVVWAGMKKEGFPERFKSRKEELLRGMFGHVASEVSRRLRSRHMDIVMDRRLHKEKERNEFDSILKGAVLTGHAGYFPPTVRVRHIDSFNSYGLQVADLVAGAVFQAVEFNDDSFVRLIEGRIEHGELMY